MTLVSSGLQPHFNLFKGTVLSNITYLFTLELYLMESINYREKLQEVAMSENTLLN